MIGPNDEFDPQRWSWAALLGHWSQFARATAALPNTGEAGRVRESATDLITLQAVWFALQHLDELDADERALGLDRAEVLIDRHSEAMRKRFADVEMPEQLQRMIDEAHAQVQRAKH